MASIKKLPNNKAAVRREKVLDAARELFFKKGYKGTTISDIAKLADYSKRSVYLDFNTKDDLFVTICLEGLEIFRSLLDEVDFENASYEELVQKAALQTVKFSKEHSEYFRMNFKEASPEILNNCDSSIRKATARLERSIMEVPVSVVKKGIADKSIPPMDPYKAAMIFTAGGSSVLLLAITGNQTLISQDEVEKRVVSTISSIKDGLRYQANHYYAAKA